jgi:hypothetical protein
MKRQRLLLASVAGILVLSLGLGARAQASEVRGPSAGVVIGSHGWGVWIGGPVVEHRRPPVVHREVVVTRPWRERFVRIGCPPEQRVETVIVHRPAVVPPVIVENGPVEVWITNSNGSKTSVKLTREGRWYIGPRGEYYAGMPTNEQLRVVYGF